MIKHIRWNFPDFLFHFTFNLNWLICYGCVRHCHLYILIILSAASNDLCRSLVEPHNFRNISRNLFWSAMRHPLLHHVDKQDDWCLAISMQACALCRGGFSHRNALWEAPIGSCVLKSKIVLKKLELSGKLEDPSEV